MTTREHAGGHAEEAEKRTVKIHLILTVPFSAPFLRPLVAGKTKGENKGAGARFLVESNPVPFFFSLFFFSPILG
jgi:hypothetical protein